METEANQLNLALPVKADEQKELRFKLAERRQYAVRQTEGAVERMREINMNKSKRGREIKELFLARAMIRFAPSQVGWVAVNMSYCTGPL